VHCVYHHARYNDATVIFKGVNSQRGFIRGALSRVRDNGCSIRNVTQLPRIGNSPSIRLSLSTPKIGYVKFAGDRRAGRFEPADRRRDRGHSALQVRA
jgi:hypothetical protein